MKNLIWALVFAALAILIPVLAWTEYSRVSKVYDGGEEGTLTIEELIGTRTSRKGAKTYSYLATLEGTTVSLSTDRALSKGVPYRVIYLREKLNAYGGRQQGSFYDYILGNKSESKWDLFVRKIKAGLLLFGVGLEVLWIVCAVLFFRSFLRKEE